MRISRKASIVLGVLAAGMATTSQLHAQDFKPNRVAVIDVAYIFKNHPGIKAQVEQVENSLKTYDAELAAKRQELQQAAEKLKNFKVGSPEYSAQEEQVAGMESKLRLDMARKRQELSQAEARIYYDNYTQIAEAVKYLANYYKIDLVLRYNSEEMNLEQGESVIRGVMKNIVYHDPNLDMTKGVMQYLDTQTAKRAPAAPAAVPR